MAFDVPTLALTCAVLLAAGGVVLGVCSVIPPLARAARAAWPVLFTETLIVGVAAGAIWAGGWVLTAALAALALRVGYEAAAVAFPGRARTVWAVALAAPAAGFAAAALPLAWAVWIAAALFVAALTLSGSARGTPGKLLALFAFPLVPLAVFVAAGQSGGGAWLLAAFILVETFDSYALLGGKLFGRRKAFPRLSPGKTVEGLLAGAAMLMLTAAGAGWLLDGATPAQAMAVALVAGALTVIGDLAASRLKRAAGVKDFPAVLPHQGGLFDIADAWIATGAGLAGGAALIGAI